MTRVLIVGSDTSDKGLLDTGLHQAGFSVLYIHIGLLKTEIVRSWEPDVIILDFNIPDMSGYEACHSIRMISQVPVLILSVNQKPESVALALDNGADDYMVKPVHIKVLVARLKTLARRAHPEMTVNGVQYKGG